MRLLAIALTAIAVVLLAGSAEATTLAGTEGLPSAPRDFSPVEKVGCGGPGRCPAGLHWGRGPYGGGGWVGLGGGRCSPFVCPPLFVRPPACFCSSLHV